MGCVKLVAMSHRLFVGSPVPEPAAALLHAWAEATLPRDGVRLVRPEQLHVTVLAYPKADQDLRDRLVALTAEVEWDPIPVVVGKAAMFGRSAIALTLESAHGGAIATLEQRLLRPFGEPARAWAKEPLAHLLVALAEPELDRFRRMREHGTGLRLHVTVARSRGWKPAELEPPPALAFALDRLVLYESVLGPEGSAYTELVCSQGGSGDP